MLSDSSCRSIALFFHLSCLNDEVTKTSSLKMAKLLEKAESDFSDEFEKSEDFVRISHQLWKKNSQVEESLTSQSEVCVVDKSFPWKQWKSFRKKSSSEELLIVIWSQILGFSVEEIARGMDETQGTIRYRLSRGLCCLGECSGA